MPIPDCATIFVANMETKKYFEAEGLRIETQIVQGGGIALPKLESGELQFAIMNYVAAIQKEAEEPGVIKLVTDAYQAVKGAFVLMAPKDSPIQSVGDLRGRHVSVLTLNSVGTLTLESALKVHGLTKKDLRVSERPVTEMIAALDNGIIDAAWLTEPFITAYGTQHGGRKLADMMEGQTENLPIAAWATSGTFAEDNPQTVRAFQRAMLLAQKDVAEDRSLVTRILPTYTKIDPTTATTIVIGTFPIDLAVNRVQRVADLMRDYGYIKAPIDAAKLLAPQSAMPTPAASMLPPAPSPTTTRTQQGLA